MGTGISVFLMAAGAVLAFAVDVPTTGIDIDTVGVILMFVGLFVLLYTIVWWSDAMPWRRDRTVIRERYVEPPPPVEDGDRVYRERRVIEHEKRAS